MPSRPIRHVVLSAPYDEGAMWALMRHSAGDPAASAFLRRKPGAAVAPVLSRLGASGIAARLARRPEDLGSQVFHLAGSWELVRLAVALFGRPGTFSRDVMFSSARGFDKALARRLTEPAVLLGMPGACAAAFSRNHRLGGQNVFHAVNAHPLAHNAALLRRHDAADVAAELIPDPVIETVEAELTACDFVLSPSLANTTGFVTGGVDAQKIITIPYAVDLEHFDSTKHPVVETTGPLRAVFVGQISYRKGVDVLIAAARQLIGTHEIELYGPLVAPELLRQLPPNVRYLGMASRSELPRLLGHADAFVLPTLEDACALVTFEAAAMGLPVLSTRANGATERLTPVNLTYVDVDSASDLAEQLGKRGRHSLEARHWLTQSFRENFAASDWPAYAADVWKALDLGGPCP